MLYNFRFTDYANNIAGIQIYPGDTVYNCVNDITSKMNGINYYFDENNYLKLKNPILGATSESLIEQILSIDSEYTDKSTLNRVIFQTDDQVGYAYDYSNLSSASGINDERLGFLRASALNEYSASSAANFNLVQSKKYSNQFKLRLWGNPSINIYDTVFFSNSRYGISQTFVVYEITNSVDSKAGYYTTVSLGRPLWVL